MKLWLGAFLLAFPLLVQAQNIAPLSAPSHQKDREHIARFNEILTHPQNTEKTAWEWYEFTDDTGWTVGGYNWAVVKWNEGFHTTAIDYFKWLSNHCEDPDGTREPDVCKLSKRNIKLK